MPTYEYRCKDCGHELEVVQSFTDDPLTECPVCQGELKKVFPAVGISFKGSGFYKTDARAGAKGRERSTAPSRRRRRRASSDPKSETKSDKKTDSSSLVVEEGGGQVGLTLAAELGVFGGSGFYSFLDELEERVVSTPYGDPAGPLHVGTIGGRQVAFLPRHGPSHEYPPHRINYRANLWAMREAGVTRILAPCASGSLQPNIHPGEFVVCDQLVDRTWGRRGRSSTGPSPTTSRSPTPTAPSCGGSPWRRPRPRTSPCTIAGRSSPCRGLDSPPEPSRRPFARRGGRSST